MHNQSSLRKLPAAARKRVKSPVDRGKEGAKRSTVVDARGIPLGTVVAPANRHDSPLLDATLETLEPLGELPDRASVHLDRGYDSKATREKLEARGLSGVIAQRGKPAPLQAAKRWVVERTNSRHNAHTRRSWRGVLRGAGG